jgi:hypothetical protein
VIGKQNVVDNDGQLTDALMSELELSKLSSVVPVYTTANGVSIKFVKQRNDLRIEGRRNTQDWHTMAEAIDRIVEKIRSLPVGGKRRRKSRKGTSRRRVTRRR